MRELTVEEVGLVGGSGEISPETARNVVVGFGGAVIGGAIVGGLSAGPVGFVSGAIIGAGRAAFSYGLGALLSGAFALAC